MSYRKWLERLAYSFIILAAVLGWEAWRIHTGKAVGTTARLTTYVVVGALLLGAGLAGVRSRHRE